MPAPVRISAEKLRSFVISILCSSGASELQAGIVAEVLVWCDQVGRSTNGVWRLSSYMKRLALGLLKCPCNPQYLEKTTAMGLIDGDQGFGQYVGHIAMLRAIDLARETGVGLVGAYNSNHFGAGAYYIHLACKSGMLGIATSNSFPRQTAFGGVKPVLGTNPFAFGAPQRNGRSMLLDMATSASADSLLRKHEEEGGCKLPVGIAIDTGGNPITDSGYIGQYTLLPFGGAKGYGLALMVEILSGVITGAGIAHEVKSVVKNFESSGNNGHLFIAIAIEKFMPMDIYYERMETLTSLVRSSSEGFNDKKVLIPGETRWDEYDRNSQWGIPVDRRTCSALETLAWQYGVPVPW